MKSIEIYTSMLCPFCARAKALLKSKGVQFKEIDVTADAALRQVMMKRAEGAHTVPQIFVDDMHIGDCDYIHKLDAAGKLNQILGIA
ncbi:glutaredoxin 3 [Sneathiella chinensis]|uniref:Glutaredoxin n=1 Tax=Sneathiella chinensis TaxID=349750 RepID=A0ABQ5U808_9PROT|nr:glutaredoxin 3 [Sneathiella chinensis]GLQ08048.1 glutaredoxin 3 [Sneathiella chinensis]